MSNTKLSKRERRRQRKNGNGQEQHQRGLQLDNVKPLTKTQERVFHSYNEDKNLVLHGCAGTGKTYLGLYLGLRDVLDRDYEEFDKVVVVRSAVQTRNQGFLPGKLEEKSAKYEDPYISICSELFGRGDAYDILKQKGQIEFLTTSFVRGISLNNCIVIVDEMQNMNDGELNSVMTRVGKDSKIIFSGDYRQTDLNSRYDKSGIKDFLYILDHLESFDKIEFNTDDIVRSGIVKEYIKKREELGFTSFS